MSPRLRSIQKVLWVLSVLMYCLAAVKSASVNSASVTTAESGSEGLSLQETSGCAHGTCPGQSDCHGNGTKQNTSCLDGHNDSGHGDGHGDDHGHGHGHTGVTVIAIHFEEVKTPVLIGCVILLATLTKLGFHHLEWLSSKLPESCLLIVVGVIMGAILHFSGGSNALPHIFESHEFFLYLLPPIILEASFSLHDDDFFDNLKAILTYSVIGTTLACFLVGGALYGLAIAGAMGYIHIGFIEVLIFSALICAVDPVAVLAVFEEIGVNNSLYFLVFGESLLNDGVTVVIYKVMQQLNEMDTVGVKEGFLGVAAFVVVAGLGFMIGMIGGLITAFITRFTGSVRIVEPISVFCFAYLSFLVAEIFQVSGIISIIAFGLIQRQYTFSNINEKSRTTIEYFAKVIATTNEIIIFLFLGLALVRPDHHFHVGFCLWTLLLVLLLRFAITFGLTCLLNRFDFDRTYPISLQEQFIISYGGLRGAVSFSLVALLDPKAGANTQMFVTTTLAVIIFTVFIQGITIKPFVYLFEIGLNSKEQSTFYQELSVQVIGDLMNGVDAIINFKSQNRVRNGFCRFKDRYLSKVFQKYPSSNDEEIFKIYSEIALREHLETLKASGASKMPHSNSIRRALGGAEPEVFFDRQADTDSETKIDEMKPAIQAKRQTDHKSEAIIKSAFDLRRFLAKSHNQGAGHDKDLSKDQADGLAAQLEEKRKRFQRLKKNPVRKQMQTMVRMAMAAGNRQSISSVSDILQFRRMSSIASCETDQSSILDNWTLLESQALVKSKTNDSRASGSTHAGISMSTKL